jgi:hypothetical protein
MVSYESHKLLVSHLVETVAVETLGELEGALVVTLGRERPGKTGDQNDGGKSEQQRAVGPGPCEQVRHRKSWSGDAAR